MARLTHRIAPSCVYFVTTKAWGNRNIFQVAETSEIVIEVLLRYRADDFYLLHEFVLMPDHLHLLLTPAGTTTLEKAIQLIKGASSYEIHKRRSNAMQIWQPGFREWTIRDGEDFRVKAHYIQNNPVAAKLVRVASEWPYGSAAGRFRLDPPPATFPAFTSGAKAPASQGPSKSELKLRPPELKLRAPELKLRAPELKLRAPELMLRPPVATSGDKR
jgi:putative transposase